MCLPARVSVWPGICLSCGGGWVQASLVYSALLGSPLLPARSLCAIHTTITTITRPAHLSVQVAEYISRELSAGSRLRELLSGHSAPPATQEGVAALAAAIAAAEPFGSLAADVEAARALHRQSCAKAEAAAQLQAVVDEVAALAGRVMAATAGSSGVGSSGSSGAGSSGGGARAGVLGLPLIGFGACEWQQHIAVLEAAADAAKDANVSVTKVRGAKW